MKQSRVFSTREKVLLVILALLIVGAAYYFFVHQPVTETLTNADAEIEMYNMQSGILAAKLEKLNVMKAELDELKKHGEPAEIPDYDNLPVVITFLDTVLSTKKNYKLSLSDPSFSEDGIARRNANVSFTASSYKDACNAIETLQNCPFMCKVDNVSISPASKPIMEDTNLSVGINLVFYESVK